ncbi:A24 family peptidase [Symbiobacterium terraclitae]|uniref:A24 family peptidase n=1 Tax=Symbiobacterium terraclitae TaxID=557451 RepID=UPI0035B512DB
MSLIALVTAAIAAWCDVRTRTIPDRLTVPLLALGSLVSLHLRGPWITAGTLLIGGALCELIYRTGALAGGDLKLLLGFALLCGPVAGVYILYLSLLAALPLFLFFMLRYRTLRPSIPYAVAILAAVTWLSWRDLA